MGERKVLNKYFPPDFDPAKLPRRKRGDANDQMKVRMMLPMSIRCNTCGVYMYKGTKFNTRKEDVHSEKYLDSIMVFRFYFRCSKCSAEITMKTDPKNSDYVMENGASRNHEPWRDKDKTVGEAIAARAAEEEGNAMKALENRTLDSKREMDIMSALDELQSLNRRQVHVDTGAAIAALQRSIGDSDGEIGLEEEDEAALRAMLQAQKTNVRRIDDSELGTSAVSAEAAAIRAAAKPAAKPLISFATRPLAVMIKKRKAEDGNGGVAPVKAKPAPVVESDEEEGGLLGLGNYGTSSGSES